MDNKSKNKAVIGKSYRYLDHIGEGGYGFVVKAEQISTGKVVALKILKIQEGLPEKKRVQQLARFDREALLCAKINHPNIVNLIDKGYSEDGNPYAVFEYVDGETLKSYILRNKRLSSTEMAALMEQVLDALICAHKKGIVHRDLKPNNIMVFQMGSKKYIKILDFGVGTFTHEFQSTHYRSLTLTQEILGTPIYTAPEQLKGEPPTIKSDLYSWGLIVIECLTGKPVIDGFTVADVFHKQLTASNVPIPASIAGHDLGRLLRKVLEKKTANRAEDTQAILKEFEQINFNTLVGDIEVKKTEYHNSENKTLANNIIWSDSMGGRKQLTVLCFRLNIDFPEGREPDPEILDTIQKDQMSRSIDIAGKYNGHVTEPFFNTVAVFFGYPESNDTDARRAGKTALDLLSEIKKRCGNTQEQFGIQINIQISIHTGAVLIRPDCPPKGKVLNITLDLVHSAKPQSILASSSSRKLLTPYFEFEDVGEFNISNGRERMLTYRMTGNRKTETSFFSYSHCPRSKLIGRDKETIVLLKAWNKVENEGHAVFVSGVAGIGKTKLIHEVKKHVQNNGKNIHECRCFPEYRNNALYPFLNMFSNHWGIVEPEDANFVIDQLKNALKNAGCKVEESLPILCSWLSVPISKDYMITQKKPEEQKQLLFNTLKLCLINLEAGEPFLLTVEDLHWIDITTIELIEYILESIDECCFLLLLSSRPVFKNPWQFNALSQIKLDILSNNQIALLVKENLNGNSVSKKALNYISKRADGIPLYAKELTTMLLEQKYMTLNNGVYDLVKDINTKMIPTTLQDLLNSKLDKLSSAKETAQQAATIGRKFSYELLKRVSLKDEAAIQSDLYLLIQADLVYKQPNEKYIFRHALIRDAAYEGILNSNLKKIHTRIAHALENDFPILVQKNPFITAYHFAKASLFHKAFHYGKTSIKQEIRNSNNSQAIHLKDIVLNWNKNIKTKSIRIENELILNDLVLPAYMAISGYGSHEVEIINKQNEKLLDDIHANQFKLPKELLEGTAHKIEWGLFLNYHFQSKRKEASKIANNILDSLKAFPNRKIELGVLPLIAQAFHADGNMERAIALCKRTIKIYNKKTDVEIGIHYNMEPYSAAHFLLSNFYFVQGKPETAIAYIKTAIAWAKEIKHPVSITLSYLFYALIAYFLGDKNLMLQIICGHDNSTAGKAKGNWVTTHLNMMEAWAKGDTAYGESYVSDILNSGQHYALSWYEPSLAETYLDNGQTDKAITLLENSLARSLKENETWSLTFVRRLLAQCYYTRSKKPDSTVMKQLNLAIIDAQATGAKWFEIEALAYKIELLPHYKSETKELKIILLERIQNLPEITHSNLYKRIIKLLTLKELL